MFSYLMVRMCSDGTSPIIACSQSGLCIFIDMIRCLPKKKPIWKLKVPLKLGTIGSIPLKDPNFRYIPWTPHVIDSCGPTCK
jgi:hypothetical protein